ncbi:MAG: DNA polymerase III subunit delta' [Dokdonella sp.]
MSVRQWLLPVWNRLAETLAQGRPHHAMLIAGAAGLGKREFAEALIASVLCSQRHDDLRACGGCKSCLLLAAGSHPDRILLTFEARAKPNENKLRTELVVDQVRALSQRLSLSSQFGGLQLALIEPAEALNENAANALLKTLEEPTAASVMILVCNDPSRLPATIRSRCQRIDVAIPARELALDWLRAKGLTAERAATALDTVQGNPGAACQLIEDGGLDLREQCERDLVALTGGRASALAIADSWAADRPEQRLWLAAILARDEAQRIGVGEAGRFGLTRTMEIQKLAAWFGHANRVRRLLDTPVRSDLLLLDLMRDWHAATNP